MPGQPAPISTTYPGGRHGNPVDRDRPATPCPRRDDHGITVRTHHSLAFTRVPGPLTARVAPGPALSGPPRRVPPGTAAERNVLDTVRLDQPRRPVQLRPRRTPPHLDAHLAP